MNNMTTKIIVELFNKHLEEGVVSNPIINDYKISRVTSDSFGWINLYIEYIGFNLNHFSRPSECYYNGVNMLKFYGFDGTVFLIL